MMIYKKSNRNSSYYVNLMKFQNNNLIFFKRVNINNIKNIKFSYLKEEFNKLVIGEIDKEKFFIGEYKNFKYILNFYNLKFHSFKINRLYTPLINTNIYRKSLFISIKGRLNGVNKARKYTIGHIKTNTKSLPIDYSQSPIQTKWGKFGVKIYTIPNL